MSKVVLITGSPRSGGNSGHLASKFETAAKEAGIEVVKFDAVGLNMRGCYACNGCFQRGACVIEQKFNEVAEAILDADGVVLAFPVYWYAMPAQIKSLWDHFYAFCVGQKDLSGKKAAMISCCAEPDEGTFAGVKFAFEKTMELLQVEVIGEVLATGLQDPGAAWGTEWADQAAALAEKFA